MRLLVFTVLLASCAPPTAPATPPGPGRAAATGILVMAHGGSPSWNRTVEVAARGAASQGRPVVVAFGMADPATLSDGLDSLRRMGVARVAVVRLFVSGESFRAQTRHLLGLDTGPLPAGVTTHHGHASGSTEEVPPRAIARGLEIATHDDGLMDAPESARILSDRAGAVSVAPEAESVLLLAHGMATEVEDDRLVAAMERTATAMRALRFGSVGVATLREDWPEARQRSERVIRAFVSSEADAGRRVIVVPFRLSGFGPYATVLSGLPYTPTDGLLPHPAIADWIGRKADEVACAQGWHHCARRGLPEPRPLP